MKYSEIIRWLAVPLNYRAHRACLLLEALGHQFCVDYGYMNAEDIVEAKGLEEDLDFGTERRGAD